MIGNSLRRLGIGLLAGAGVGLLGLTSATHACADETAYVIGGSGARSPIYYSQTCGSW